jgi:hypothetical protein
MEDMLPASALASLKLSRSALFLSFKKIYQGKFLSFFFIVLLFLCVYKAWVISPPCPLPLPNHPLHPLLLPPQGKFQKAQITSKIYIYM